MVPSTMLLYFMISKLKLKNKKKKIVAVLHATTFTVIIFFSSFFYWCRNFLTAVKNVIFFTIFFKQTNANFVDTNSQTCNIVLKKDQQVKGLEPTSKLK
jgi:hypothetical protein